MTTLIEFEGILQSTGNNTPILPGRFLLEALRTLGRVVVLTTQSEEYVTQWLWQNKLVVDDLITPAALIDPADNPRIRQIQTARTRGLVELVVTTEPAVITWCLNQGVPSLLFAHPEHLIPTSRPGHQASRRSWDEIQEELIRRRKAAE